ncbi:MAG: MFS transporter [Candidatus Latescibacteria bacterium]|nr:MFS transporter [Candidatus Latescibacterota bacterium]
MSKPVTDTPGNRSGVFLGIGLMYLAAFQIFKLPPVLPLLLDTYAYDRTLAGAFMSIYAAAGLLLSVPLGKVMSHRGPQLLIYTSLSLTVLGNLLGVSYPETGGLMLLGRGLEGIGFAGLAIVGPVLANRSVSPIWFPLIISLTAIWIPVGQLVAGVLAPLVVPYYSWQGLWWIGLVATGVIAFAVAGLLGRQTSTQGPRAEDGNRIRDLAPQERSRLVMAASVFAIFSIQYFAFMTCLPQYLVEVLGLTATQSALGYLIPIIIVIPVSLLTGWMFRIGFRLDRMMVLGMIMIAVVWALVPSGNEGMSGIGLMIVYGIGAGITPTCLFAMPTAIVGKNGPTASAFGIIMTGRNLGVLVGPVLLAMVFDLSGGWSFIAPLFFTTTAAGTVVAMYLRASLKTVETPF